jgi:succinate dehydrogenase / fumarate reductase, flavoprotein subunit
MTQGPGRFEHDDVRAVDILVLGGGVAGMFAALKAHAGGANVLLASKGPIGRSGGTIFAGTLLAYLDPTEFGYQASTNAPPYSSSYYYLMDEAHLARSATYVREVLLGELEEMGLYYRRTSDGRILHNPTRPKNTWTPKMGMSGRAIGDLLRRRVFDAGIPVLEETAATSLLVAGDQCVGATLLNIVTGEFFPVRAKAVVLATGHANYLAKRSTGTREVCGDGLAIPFRAKAEMYNLEIVEWHVSDMVSPPAWSRLHIYPNPLPETRETARLVTEDGAILFEQKQMPEVNKPYHYQHLELVKYARDQRIPYEKYKKGNYYSDLRHIDPRILSEYSYQTQFPRKLGLDLSKDRIENAPSYHFTLGGVWVDWNTMESPSLRRLFGAGAATGRDGQTDCMYEGKCAAEAAFRIYGHGDLPPWDRTVFEREAARVYGVLESSSPSGPAPITVKEAIRSVMWKWMDYIKNEAKMRTALAELAEIRQNMVPRMTIVSKTRNYNYDWVDGLDVYNMLDACVLTINASLHRRESRGPFYREDHPLQDNSNWLRFIILQGTLDDMRIREQPVDLPASVPRGTTDFFKSIEP